MLSVGDRAPEFAATATSGERVSLSALRGRKVVVYFYPKAFTPGCTAEARRFRDNYDELRALGAEVIGVSVDDHETQCDFAARNQVRFPLIADQDKAISRAFGVLWPLLPVFVEGILLARGSQEAPRLAPLGSPSCGSPSSSTNRAWWRHASVTSCRSRSTSTTWSASSRPLVSPEAE